MSMHVAFSVLFMHEMIFLDMASEDPPEDWTREHVWQIFASGSCIVDGNHHEASDKQTALLIKLSQTRLWTVGIQGLAKPAKGKLPVNNQPGTEPNLGCQLRTKLQVRTLFLMKISTRRPDHRATRTMAPGINKS